MGVPSPAWKQLAAQDIGNVMRGGAPMPNQQVNVALQSQAIHAPVIAPPQPRTGWSHILGNVASDVGGIITGAIPGAISYVHHLPSEATATYKALTDKSYAESHGYEISTGGFPYSPTNVAMSYRNIARLPLLQPVPFAHTLANLTTAQGRASMQQHPVSTLLDVLPAIAAGAEIGSTAAFPEAATGSAAEAFQQGKVFRGVARAASDVIGQTPLNVNPRLVLADRLSQLGASESIREGVMRPYSQIARRVRGEAKSFWNEISPTFEHLSPEERTQLYDEASRYEPATQTVLNTDGTHSPVSPSHQAILDKVQELNDRFKDIGIDRGKLQDIPLVNSGGKKFTYSTDSPVVRHFNRFRRTADLLYSARVRHDAAMAKVADRELKLSTRQGKVRRFMEREEDFNARPESTVGFDAVRDAAQPFIESFRHLDPRTVYTEILSKITRGDVRTQTARQIAKDINALEGEGGHVAQFENALQARDLRGAQKAATNIARVFRHKGWDNFGTGQTLRSFMGDIRDELIGLSGRERSHGYAARQLRAAQDQLETAQANVTKYTDRAKLQHGQYTTAMAEKPPASMIPYLQQLVRSGAIDRARELYQGSQLEDAIRTLRTSPSTQAMEAVLPTGEFNAIMKSAVGSWTDLARAGLEPKWLHTVQPEQYRTFMYAKPLTERLERPSQFENSVFNFTPHMQDITAAVTAAGLELIREAGTQEFLLNHIIKYFAQSTQEIHAQYVRDIERTRTGVAARGEALTRRQLKAQVGEDMAGQAKRLMSKEWESFNPETYGISNTARLGRPGELSIPIGVARSLKAMMQDFKLPVAGDFLSKVNNIYKLSVLTGPRHIVHVGIGGMMMAMLREPSTILHIVEAAKMVREGRVPVDLTSQIYDMPTDGIFGYAAGKTLGRHFAEAVGSVPRALSRFEEFMATTERAATMLAGEAKGLEREAAIRAALKVYVDMDNMSYLERTVIRQIFPFYAFTRHLFRYLFTYPVDHPIRAAIISRFGNMEQQDWNTGLPQKYQQLFFLGSPDHNGNVNTIEYRSINPFRSFYSNFSLAGFVSSLNPLIAAPFIASGVNNLAATPELYPETTYDPVSGAIVAKRPSVLAKMTGAFIPEFGAIDHFANLTNDMKQLKASNPDAYRRQLFSSLNLTFYPSTVNVPFEQEKTQMHLFQAAQNAVNLALKTGNYGDLARYNLAPFQGTLVTPDQLQQYATGIQQQAQTNPALANVSAKAVIPNVNRGRRTTPRSPRAPRVGPRNPGPRTSRR